MITPIPTITGISIAMIEPTNETPISPVFTTAFPVPAVNLVDPNRSKDVPACITPAVPPPIINPNIHCHVGSKWTMVDALTKVPANTATGVAMVSSTLSTTGI